MIVLDLKAIVESGFDLGPATADELSPTGEPYVEIANPAPTPSEDAACVGMLSTFFSYAKGRSGKLYWRQEPVLELRDGNYRVLMRCLISDQPEIQQGETV